MDYGEVMIPAHLDTIVTDYGTKETTHEITLHIQTETPIIAIENGKQAHSPIDITVIALGIISAIHQLPHIIVIENGLTILHEILVITAITCGIKDITTTI
jgi:hypothetical protein